MNTAHHHWTKYDLLQRGWTNHLIRQWLGEPDEVGRGYYGPSYLYDMQRVLSAEPSALAAKRRPKPPQEIDILPAIFALNRRAKRHRDTAKRYYDCELFGFASANKWEKMRLYEMKGQVLAHLLAEGRLAIVGHHQFRNGLFTEILAGEGYRFHRPCPPVKGEATLMNDIEAKPRDFSEPRLTDALYTVEQFLAERGEVAVYEWGDEYLGGDDDEDGDDYYPDEDDDDNGIINLDDRD